VNLTNIPCTERYQDIPWLQCMVYRRSNLVKRLCKTDLGMVRADLADKLSRGIDGLCCDLLAGSKNGGNNHAVGLTERPGELVH
jgi:hypothetical protein